MEDADAEKLLEDEEVFRQAYPGLRRFAAACAPADMEPDDLVQEAVAATLRHHSLSSLENPAAYLRTAILNTARNRYRKSTPRWTAPENCTTVDAYPSELAVLSSLRMNERAALFLIDLEGYTFREAAAVLDCSVAALKARTIRARRKLRRDLQNEGVCDE